LLEKTETDNLRPVFSSEKVETYWPRSRS